MDLAERMMQYEEQQVDAERMYQFKVTTAVAKAYLRVIYLVDDVTWSDPKVRECEACWNLC